MVTTVNYLVGSSEDSSALLFGANSSNTFRMFKFISLLLVAVAFLLAVQGTPTGEA